MRKTSLARVLAGEAVTPPPVWLMRQAGRYLPEYRKVRAAAGSFLDLCYSPKLAAEVTLQPVHRFDVDCAILFSDILVIPDGLGQKVRFEAGEGPVLDALAVSQGNGMMLSPGAVSGLKPARVMRHLAPVLETVSRVRENLDGEKALIGFCGAPWTVATYMVAGRGTPDQRPARLLALADPEGFGTLIEILVGASIDYLVGQIDAGVDAVQIFDSWAGVLDDDLFERWAVAPVAAIVAGVRSRRPDARIILFAKGCGQRLAAYAAATGGDGYGIDWTMPLAAARQATDKALQGNLDPLRLMTGGRSMEDGVERILGAMDGHPHIFNLGHGIQPDTPPEHVGALVRRVRGL